MKIMNVKGTVDSLPSKEIIIIKLVNNNNIVYPIPNSWKREFKNIYP